MLSSFSLAPPELPNIWKLKENGLSWEDIHDQFRVAFHKNYESGTLQQHPQKLKSIQQTKRDEEIQRSKVDAESLKPENQLFWELKENDLSWEDILDQFRGAFHKNYKSGTLKQRLKKMKSIRQSKRDEEIRGSRHEEDKLLWELKEKGLSWKDILDQFRITFNKVYTLKTLKLRFETMKEARSLGSMEEGTLEKKKNLHMENRLIRKLKEDKSSWKDIQNQLWTHLGTKVKVSALTTRWSKKRHIETMRKLKEDKLTLENGLSRKLMEGDPE